MKLYFVKLKYLVMKGTMKGYEYFYKYCMPDLRDQLIAKKPLRNIEGNLFDYI